MNPAAHELSAPSDVVPMLGLPREQLAKRELTNSVDDALRSISALLNSLILKVLDARTAEEFSSAFAEVYPQYFRLLRSFTEIAAAAVPPQVTVRLNVESLNQLEDNLRSGGEESFGPEMTERALFTVFTLRKIAPILYSVTTSSRKVETCDVEKDRDFSKNFLVHALVARLSIDCLIVAMDNNRTIYPDVLASLDNRMRAVVDAYAWVRQARDLRTKKDAIDMAAAFPPLDDEDQQLLNESMMDLSLDPADDAN